MQTVKALIALPGRQEGSVFQVDEDSAKVLAERGHVELVDEAGESGGLFTTASTRRSGAAVTQVAAADYPEQPDGDDVELAPLPDGAQLLPPAVADADGFVRTEGVAIGNVTKASNKADLVAVAVGKVKHDDGTDYTAAELESLPKPELVAKLGL
ncbi:hypothetical protein [Mycolicibacterium llatzerense]|uniref:hypothetical protein n=1 Tax=Mycolicibacterium llatzerense TaxID=280871 RepID=UPI0021B54F8C|nr:hypothetical protein [Mycolicibacterium llatzerense]MCT7372690.1 hypothetical protein [Mycolicibacterium llatzerense]